MKRPVNKCGIAPLFLCVFILMWMFEFILMWNCKFRASPKSRHLCLNLVTVQPKKNSFCSPETDVIPIIPLSCRTVWNAGMWGDACADHVCSALFRGQGPPKICCQYIAIRHLLCQGKGAYTKMMGGNGLGFPCVHAYAGQSMHIGLIAHPGGLLPRDCWPRPRQPPPTRKNRQMEWWTDGKLHAQVCSSSKPSSFQELRGLKNKRKVDNNVPLPVGIDL